MDASNPKNVQLYFHKPSYYCVGQGSAMCSLVLANNPTAYNQVLNQGITLACKRRFMHGEFSSPEMYIPRVGIFDFNFIERYSVNIRFIRKHLNSVIKQMIDEGFYILFTLVDDYYLPGKSWYGTRHFSHDGIICGYDEEKQTYSVAGYNVNWLFDLMEIPWSAFEEGVDSCFNNGEYGYLYAAKVKDVQIDIDPKTILKFAKIQLDSNLEKYPPDKNGNVEGVVVYDYLSMYLDKLNDGSIPHDHMDWRSTRHVWEHKKCLLDMLKAVETHFGWDSSLSTAIEPLVDVSNRLRMTYALYHKTPRPSMIPTMKNCLAIIKEKETEVLSVLVKKIEEEINREEEMQ